MQVNTRVQSCGTRDMLEQCIREKMDVIDIDDDTIDAGVLDSMAVTQVCAVRCVETCLHVSGDRSTSSTP